MRSILTGARRACCGLLSLLLWLHAVPAGARGDTPAGGGAALRARAEVLFDRRAHAMREGGIPLEPLQADLIRLAADLEAARLDSLASDARWWAANLSSRMANLSETDRQLLVSIADALKAHDERRVMRGRLWQADLRALSDPPLAIRTVEASLARLRVLGWNDLLGNAYSTEGRAYMEMGLARESYTAARRSAAHYAEAADLPGQLWALSQCSQALRYLVRHAEAMAITDSAIAMARQARLSRPLSRALLERASILRTSYDLQGALRAVNEALEEDRRRGDAGTATTTRLFRARILLMMSRAAECAADTDTLLGSPGVQQSMNATIHVASVRARALVLLSRAADADTLLEGLAARYDRFRDGLASDEARAGAGEHAAELYATWARIRLVLGRPEEAWQVSERGHAVALRERLGIGGRPALPAVEERLRRTHAALLEYDILDPGMANVFRVSGDGVTGVALDRDVSATDLEAVLDRCRSLASVPGPDSAAIRISEALLAGVWKYLGPGIERLYVVAPARFESVPFEALPEPEGGGGRTLGERFTISYTPSAAALLAFDLRTPPAGGLTVLADPVVDARQPAIAALDPRLRGAVLRPLPGAREEARRLAQPGATLLLGRDATLARFEASRSAAVLHFATHAFDLPRSPAGGGLLLAGKPGLLTSAAIESLGVAADLVTLSGCATLGSTSYSGEGTFGLARAFLVGGCRSVVSTRWDVSDRGATRFMQEFYAGLRAGQPRDRSLSRARDALLHEGFPPRDCWAFMLTGVGDRSIAQWASRAGDDSGPVHK